MKDYSVQWHPYKNPVTGIRRSVPDRARVWRCFVCLALLISCGGDTPETSLVPAPVEGGRLIVAHAQEPAALIPLINPVQSTIYISNLLFSTFTVYNDRMELVPDLLTEIPTTANGGISTDFLHYRFQLRDDVVFHDGQPLTARDVVFTYRLIMNPAVNVVSRIGYDRVERMTAPDDRTVEVTLKEAVPEFESILFNGDPVLPAHCFGDPGSEDPQVNAFLARPVGSGPFRFDSRVSGSHMELSRNDRYYRGRPGLAGITIWFVPNANTLLLQLQAGEIMGYHNAEIAHLPQLERLPGITVHQTPVLTYEHLDFNCAHPVLSDRSVRRAIALSVNREELIASVYRGAGVPAWSDTHPMSPWYNPAVEPLLRYDPDGARKLLDAAGWVDRDGDGIREKGNRPLVLTITTTAGRPQRESMEQILQQRLKDIGIRLDIRNVHSTVFFGPSDKQGTLESGEFDMVLFAWSVSPLPAGKSVFYSEDHLPPNGQNFCRFRHARMTALLRRGSRSMDAQERKVVYNEAAMILAEEVPVVPLMWRTEIDPYRSDVRNFRPSPANSGDSWNAWEWRLEKQ